MKKEEMTVNELMAYYLEGSQVANGGSAHAVSGGKATVYVETVGGEGYTQSIEARAWGELLSESAIVLRLKGDKFYALSYQTYNEICDLLSRDLSGCEVIDGHMSSSSTKPGGTAYVTPKGRSTIAALAWYEIPLGRLKLFKVDGKWYAISLVASKAGSTTVTFERRRGRFANPDQRREIIWHNFDLSGQGVADPTFPRKLKYLL